MTKSIKSFAPAIVRLAATLVAALGLATTANAQGSIVVAPKRVEFDGRARSASVTVINQGSEAATFRIFFKNQRMTAGGGLEEIAGDPAAEGVLVADSLIKYSPREVTLAPGEAQSVRLLLRKPTGLANGEYRSHLFFQTVPPASSGVSLEDQTGDGKSISVNLIPVYGISIPVIVRHGELSSQAALSVASIEVSAGDEPSQVTLEMMRSGDRSVYGDIELVHIDGAGHETFLSRVNGIAVYTPLASRALAVSVSPENAALLQKGGRLIARYVTQGDKPETLAIAEKDL